MVLEVAARGYVSQSRTLAPSVCDGEPVEVRLQLEGARLRGHLTNENGLPIGGVTLKASGSDTQEIGVTESDGSYSLESLAPGRIQLKLSVPRGFGENYSLRMKGPNGELQEAALTIDAATRAEARLRSGRGRVGLLRPVGRNVE